LIVVRNVVIISTHFTQKSSDFISSLFGLVSVSKSTFLNLDFPTFCRCTNIEGFVAHLDTVDSDVTEVIISVLENFVDKAGEGKDEDPRDRAIFDVIKKYLESIEDAARKNPTTKFFLADPILRPKLDWFDGIVDKVRKEVRDVLQSLGIQNIFRSDVISRASQQFDPDLVHLTPASGKVFVQGLLDAAEKAFQAEYVELGDEDVSPPPGTSGEASLSDRVRKLEHDTEERKFNDNLMFARTREELDTSSNKAKEDRIVITGLTSTIPQPMDKELRKTWLRNLVLDVIKKVKPDFDGTLGFINQGKSNGRDMPMVEVRLNSVEVATGVRKAFAEKRKEGDGKSLGRLYMSNSVTLSTRVRVDIMKAISKKIASSNESAYVAAYSSRPILHVRSTGTNGEVINRAYTFIDSIIRFGKVLLRCDPDEAYRRAGTAFRGQIEQHFVVLRESGPVGGAAGGAAGGAPRGTRPGKRPRVNSGETSSSAKAKKK
jgi:hypothetical protein